MKTLSATLLLLLLAAGPAGAGQFHTRAGTHLQLTDYGPDLGTALDIDLAGSWAPLKELEIGLESWFAWPLPTGESTSPSSMLLRVNPALWLRWGEDSWWIYLKAGAGLAGHLRGGDFKPVWVACAASGVAVAPVDLYVYFGFELSGQIELAGDLPTRALGLGGFLGYQF